MVDNPVAPPTIDNRVAGVRFMKVGKLYHFDASEFSEVKAGDFVIVDTARGRQMGQVMGFAEREGDKTYRQIMRPASPRDLVLKQHWEQQQDDALARCKRKARQMRGINDAKFVTAQYNYDGTYLTFLFTSEDRLDTSRLRRSLQKDFEAEVDLRQIGPRDVARLMGGFGACGIERCCSTFLTDFSPVSIKMAKVQGISLNPAEITGMCGRLRCCLVYEYEQYVEARKHLPRRNKKIGTPFGEVRVTDVHPLQDMVTVFVNEEEGLKQVKREDIVPLEEYRALAEAAKSPCTKHGDEACDCGKPAGSRRADM
ncbi:MAG: PSP1 domain-containing protein, partial [Aggregatilineales bacterium]